jgi:CheY-like chemotaxis protein
MMPGIDGIETTRIIRNMGYTDPIVALSANAVVGQAAVFLDNGFDDFIPKPVDVRHLNTLLRKYVRVKQSPEGAETAEQHMDDSDMHAHDHAAQASVSPQVLEYFVKDALNAAEYLRTIADLDGNYDSEDIKLFTTAVHAMKSALANIGLTKLSAFFEEMEQAGWKNDTETIHKETPSLILKLQALIKKYKPQDAELDDALDCDYTYLRKRLHTFETACIGYDRKTAKEIVTELRQHLWPSKIKELLGIIAEQLLSGDVDETLESVHSIIELIPGNIK